MGHVGGPGGHGPMGHGGHGHVALGGGPGGLGHDAIEDVWTAMPLYHKYLEVDVGCGLRGVGGKVQVEVGVTVLGEGKALTPVRHSICPCSWTAGMRLLVYASEAWAIRIRPGCGSGLMM